MPKQTSVVKETAKLVDETTQTISEAVNVTEKKIEKTIKPVRKKVYKEFPVLFLLLITLGVTATISGLEQLLLQINFLQNNPFVLLVIGVLLLAFTGTLYKKLG